MLLAFMLFWLALPAMVFLVPGPLRKWLAAVPSLAVLLAAFTCSHMISSGERLLVAFPAMLFALKAGLLLGRYSAERCRECTGGFLIYLSVWPGFDAEPFTKRAPGMTLDAGRFIRGYVLMLAGLVGGTALAYWWHGIPAAARGVLALATIMMTVHLGYCDVLSSLMRWAGYPVTPLFDKPWCSS